MEDDGRRVRVDVRANRALVLTTLMSSAILMLRPDPPRASRSPTPRTEKSHPTARSGRDTPTSSLRKGEVVATNVRRTPGRRSVTFRCARSSAAAMSSDVILPLAGLPFDEGVLGPKWMIGALLVRLVRQCWRATCPRSTLPMSLRVRHERPL